jgi:hypothetical protein
MKKKMKRVRKITEKQKNKKRNKNKRQKNKNISAFKQIILIKI